MPDPAQLAALTAIHRRGSFDAAAAALHVTPSAISQRIRALEDAVGTLLIRRGQPCTATPAGLRLIRHHDEVALLEQGLARDLPALAPGPATLRLAVNADSLASWVLPALAAVPDVLFDLVIDDQEVSQDWLRRGEVVAAITAHPGPLQGCDTLPLGALRYLATASPDFLARHLAGATTTAARAAALTQAPSLRFNEKDRLQEAWLQSALGHAPPALPCHRMASSQAFVTAARLGLGWGMNPEVLVRADLEAGHLAEAIPGLPLDTPLYWQFSRLATPALAPLTRAIKAEAARVLMPQDGR